MDLIFEDHGFWLYDVFPQSKTIRNRSCPDGIDQGENIHHVSHQVHFGHVGSHPGWMQPLKHYSGKPRAFNTTSEIIGRFCRYCQHVGCHVEGFCPPPWNILEAKNKNIQGWNLPIWTRIWENGWNCNTFLLWAKKFKKKDRLAQVNVGQVLKNWRHMHHGSKVVVLTQ